MATQTQTIQRSSVQQSRLYDHLYDPVYLVSGERDHARATLQARTNTTKLKHLPIYPTMFSELRHQPRYEVRLDTVDPVPRFISRQWRGYQAEARDALVRYQASSSAGRIPFRQFDDPQVTGTNRYKYFRRPLIPYTQPVGPEVVWASSRQDPLLSGLERGHEQEREPTPFMKVAQTQTDYRDSEAQTDPYSPDYVIRPGSQPELVTLALLSYGCGLPAGLAEVEMIERARAKRAWEAQLPELHDVEQREKRRKMMEEQELAEWALREQEIEKLQEARLEVLMKLLKEREERHNDLNTKRLDRLWTRKQEDVRARIDRIRNEHIRTIRKMVERRRKFIDSKISSTPAIRQSIVERYSDFGSQAYAPMTRIGVFLDRNSEQYVVKNKYLANYEGLLELENSLPDFVLKPVVKPPKRQMTTSAGFMKRKYREEKQLADIHEALIDAKSKLGQPAKPLRFLQRVEKPVPRPLTPSVDVPSEEEEEKELAIIYLQQVLRGRSLQNMMYEGKEKRLELVRELRSTHALQAAEQQMLKDEKESTLLLQRQQQLYEHKESNIDEMLGSLEGESLGDMLDFLNKELVRLQEERRIHAFSLLAERERRIREAEESGLRQQEERRRREEDEIFKQVVKVHQSTVDAYLEDIIMSAVDRTANAQARREVQEMATRLNDAAYAVEEQRSSLQSEEIVSELVHGFLLPEVQKQAMRDKVHQHQRQFLFAAHEEIYTDSNIYQPSQSSDGRRTRSASSRQASTSSPSVRGSRPQSALVTSRPLSNVGTDRQESRPDSHHSAREDSFVSPILPSELRPGSQTPISEHSASPASQLASGRPQSGTPTAARPQSNASNNSRQKSRPVSTASATQPTQSITGLHSSKPQSSIDQPASRSGSIDHSQSRAESRPPSGTSQYGSRRGSADRPRSKAESKPQSGDLALIMEKRQHSAAASVDQTTSRAESVPDEEIGQTSARSSVSSLSQKSLTRGK